MLHDLFNDQGVTIFTDAANNPRKQVAGWGCWAIGDGREPFTCSAPIRPYQERVIRCELIGLRDGLERVLTEYVRQADEFILLQTDCLDALRVINEETNAIERQHRNGAPLAGRYYVTPAREERMIARVIGELVFGTGRTLYVRHVRGHRPGKGRQWVNRVTDQLAKDAAYGKEKVA